jgi:hypothetical protein
MLNAIIIEIVVHELSTLVTVYSEHNFRGKVRMVIVDLCQQMLGCCGSLTLGTKKRGVKQRWSWTL